VESCRTLAVAVSEASNATTAAVRNVARRSQREFDGALMGDQSSI
jgi:hypothetical protein